MNEERCENCEYFTLDTLHAEHVPPKHPQRERMLRGQCSIDDPHARVSSSYWCEGWTLRGS